jgi:hypothetical protein
MAILYSSAGKLAVQNIIRCPAALSSCRVPPGSSTTKAGPTAYHLACRMRGCGSIQQTARSSSTIPGFYIATHLTWMYLMEAYVVKALLHDELICGCKHLANHDASVTESRLWVLVRLTSIAELTTRSYGSWNGVSESRSRQQMMFVRMAVRRYGMIFWPKSNSERCLAWRLRHYTRAMTWVGGRSGR